MAKFKYQGIEIHQVICAQKQFNKVQVEMEVNILAWWNPDVHWAKVTCNSHIINLIVAAVLSLPQDRALNLENAATEEGCQCRTHSKDTDTKVWWFQFKEKKRLSKQNVCLKRGKICKGFHAPYTGHHLSGCGFQTAAGGVGQPFLCFQSCLPTLHFSLAPAPHSWIINLPNSRGQFCSCSQLHTHVRTSTGTRKGSRGKLGAMV